MHLVVVHHWDTDNPELPQKIAAAMEMLVFDVRQRLAVGSPVVMTSYADPQRAASIAEQLTRDGVPCLLIDTEQLRAKNAPLLVRRFRLTDAALQFELSDGRSTQLPYAEIGLILPATTLVEQGETTTTITGRKFSLGRTLATGGIPMTKKVTQKVKVSHSERDELLCVHAPGKKMLLLCRGVLDYAGLGEALQMSRTLNFAHLKNELIRRAPAALVDERLLQRAAQARLLGPFFDPDKNLDLAYVVLARTLCPAPP